ncbi:variable large family protein, partial [Borreliella burgdorferi]|uniref:variable large family protein n=1 Tax=Borreliella burgdorferi TaxID=139 RepID=UPI001E577F03
GDAAEFSEADFEKRNDRIAAAIALRGMAKDGKFSAAQADDGGNAAAKGAAGAAAKAATGDNASVGDNDANAVGAADAGSVTGIAKGIKAIVEAAKEAGAGAGKEITLEQGEDGADNKEAGKLFGANDGGATAAEAGKGAAAVTAASGQQILSAIVEAADTAAGKKADQAKNAVEAAIGDGQAAEFSDDDMKKRNDRIAAAIALRGMAKDGKFSADVKEAAGVLLVLLVVVNQLVIMLLMVLLLIRIVLRGLLRG